MLAPIYTPQNVTVAYQLNWSLSIFWNHPVPIIDWREPLNQATEQDGVRILEHRLTKPHVSQFLLSTKPSVSPAMCIRSVKGRLQYLVREQMPKAFRRNYLIHSIGSANGEAIQRYVASQVDHHPMADARVQAFLAQFQFCNPAIDLSQTRRSSHGEFLYNLHFALVHRDRAMDIREEYLRSTRDMIEGTARKKGHLLSRAGLLGDHLHWTLGCGIQESPLDIGLSYMNNFAFAQGMKDHYQYGFYAGTFGRYDLNAARRCLADQSSFHPGEPGGDVGEVGPNAF